MTSIFFITQGCSANHADTERMQGLLKEAQFEITSNLEQADVIVFNTCTVKSPAETAFFKQLKEIKQEYPYKMIVVAGCLAQTSPDKLKDYCLVGTKQIQNIVEVVEEALNDNVIKMLARDESPALDLPKIRQNPVIEIIPISRGCLSACTFCKTKAAKGNLQSYPITEIVQIAQKAVQEGVKELWLTSQDNFCYGFDINTNLAELLKELVKLSGNFKIRIGMGNPIHLLKIKDKLFPLLNHEKVFQFLHLPAQSGSDQVLKEMNRGNTNKEFLSLVKELKETIPQICLATDLIVGFPTEKDEDYWDTLELVRKVSPDVINISRFWPRNGTKAAKMKSLPGEIVKRRSKVLTDIFHNTSRIQNEKWLGKVCKVIIDEQSKFAQQWIGRNESYKQIVVHGDFKLGDILKVKIIKAERFALQSTVVD